MYSWCAHSFQFWRTVTCPGCDQPVDAPPVSLSPNFNHGTGALVAFQLYGSLPEDVTMRLNRREFLKTLIAAAVFGIKESHAGNKDSLSISSLNITVPLWIFNEKSKEKRRIQALTIEKKDTEEFVVLFKGNRRLTLNPDMSVQRLMQKNGNRATRESMLLKRILSYCLDAAFSNFASKRNPEKGASLREEIYALQAKEVIEVITIGAMYDLLSKLNNISRISSVSWDKSKRKFIVR
jgi:hypothetical protein